MRPSTLRSRSAYPIRSLFPNSSGLPAWFFWIPGVLYLYAVRDSGIVTLWIFTSIYVAIFGLLFFLRFRGGTWKQIDLLGRNEEVEVKL